MKLLVLLTIFFIGANAKELKCWVSYGLVCKAVNYDLTEVTEVTFNVGEASVEDFIEIAFLESKMIDVPKGAFEFFPDLKNFILNENDLKVWKPEYLKGGKKLTTLMVMVNPIDHLPKNAFDEAPNLELVEFSKCKMLDIDSGAFASLNKLTDLRIYGNHFGEKIRKEMFEGIGDTLLKLNLAHNKITNLPTDIYELTPNLEETSLYFNFLEHDVDAEVFPKSLKRLVGYSQFRIKNPPPGLEYTYDETYFENLAQVEAEKKAEEEKKKLEL